MSHRESAIPLVAKAIVFENPTVRHIASNVAAPEQGFLRHRACSANSSSPVFSRREEPASATPSNVVNASCGQCRPRAERRNKRPRRSKVQGIQQSASHGEKCKHQRCVARDVFSHSMRCTRLVSARTLSADPTPEHTQVAELRCEHLHGSKQFNSDLSQTAQTLHATPFYELSGVDEHGPGEISLRRAKSFVALGRKNRSPLNTHRRPIRTNKSRPALHDLAACQQRAHVKWKRAIMHPAKACPAEVCALGRHVGLHRLRGVAFTNSLCRLQRTPTTNVSSAACSRPKLWKPTPTIIGTFQRSRGHKSLTRDHQHRISCELVRTSGLLRNLLTPPTFIPAGHQTVHEAASTCCAVKNALSVGAADFICSSRGGSVMRIYATEGGLNMGKGSRGLDVARGLPSEFFSLNMMLAQKRLGFSSILQVVALLALPGMLLQGAPAETIVGGWSLGALFSYHAALQLEACFEGARACFTIDERRLQPWPLIADTSKVRSAMSKEDNARVNPRVYVNLRCAEAPRVRGCTRGFNFTCPLTEHEKQVMQEDSSIHARRVLYTSAGDLYLLPDAGHFLVGKDHYWDIARRLRGPSARSQAII